MIIRNLIRILLIAASAIAMLPASVALADDDDDRPFEYTERRAPCEDYEKYKQPFFGILHQHTGLSFDAATRFVRSRPAESYAFAQGKGDIITPDEFGFQMRRTTLDPPGLGARPLDFLGITDHSETFGEMGICLNNDENSDAPGRQSLECALLTGPRTNPDEDKPGPGFLDGPKTAPIPSFARSLSSAAFSIMATSTFLSASHGMQFPMCYANSNDCEASELEVWQEIQQAANDAYDTTSACEFTTFIAYENTSMPSGVTQHRNVIFRNDDVIERPITAIDISKVENPDKLHQVTPPTLFGNTDPTILWSGLEDECNDAGGRCEAIVIPHNTNLSSRAGTTETVMSIPGSKSERQENAELMARMQPLIEIYQVKGGSECRYDPRFRTRYETSGKLHMVQTGLAPEDVDQPGEPDEYCDFELLDARGGGAAAGLASSEGDADEPTKWSNRAFVRNVLKDGLKLEEELGVNPFQLGIGASQDDHNGRPGFVPENERFNGHTGVGDAFPTRDAGTIQNNSGGLWVAWAEENSRDSVFTALKNKETYGTSGTRPKVRFFGGWKYPKNLCSKNFVKRGYKKGVPMGGILPKRVKKRSPRFIAAAWKDDGPDGTDLQRIQIVKGWLDDEGGTHEAVFDVAVTDGPGADAFNDLFPPGSGSEHLCTVWQDPQFDPSQRAFYYARVLENPVPRYSTLICQEVGIDPFDKDCDQQLKDFALFDEPADIENFPGIAAVLERADHFASNNYQYCCAGVGDDPKDRPLVKQVIQERAWTSPIWYSPRSRH